MTFDQDELQDQITKLPHVAQVFFAFLCAERLWACCWAFSHKEQWDISKYREGYDLLSKQVVYNNPISESELERVKSELEMSIPSSEEFGDFLSVQAQNAMLALFYSLDLWLTKDSTCGVSAANAVVEGLDNYEAYVHDSLTGVLRSPNEYSLLDREIKWQYETIDILRQQVVSEVEKSVALRVLNRDYTVPIAV